MVLPQHTQLEEEVHSVGLLESEESLNVSEPTANSLLSEPQFMDEIPELLIRLEQSFYELAFGIE